MPLLLLILVGLALKGVMLPGSGKGLAFLLTPDWSKVTPVVLLTALGQSFFTLSLGQGTMITYGSYLKRTDSILGSSLPVVAMDTIVAILSAIAVMTVVFSAGVEPNQGTGLLFETLPIVFSQTAGGYFLAVGFFLLVSIAAITSEISAMEPTISYLTDKGWERRKATALCATGVFLLGIPCALSFGVLKEVTFCGMNFFGLLEFLMLDIMVPLGGLGAVICVAWVWGMKPVLKALEQKEGSIPSQVLTFCLKYCAPVLIVIVLLHAVFG